MGYSVNTVLKGSVCVEKQETQSPSLGRVSMLPCLLILLQSVLYSIGDPISKTAYRAMPVYSLLSVRYSLGVVIMLLIAGRRIIRGLRECSLWDILPACLCTACAYLLSNVALNAGTVTNVAFLRSLSTVIAPILGLLLFRTPYHRKHIPVQVMVVVGMYLLCGARQLSLGLGEICALLSATVTAFSLVFSRSALRRVDPIALAAAQTVAPALAAILCALLFDGGIQIGMATPRIWLSILYLAAVCTVGGIWLQNFALKKISVRTLALLQCTCPVMSAAISSVVLDEHLTFTGVLGCAIILGCVVAETLMRED